MRLETIEQKRTRIIQQQERRAQAEYYRNRIERFENVKTTRNLHPLAIDNNCFGF